MDTAIARPQQSQTEPETVLEPVECLRVALDRHHPKITLACSFQAENVVLIDMLMSIRTDARMFAIDTGRLPEETYEVADAIQKRYGCTIEWVFPRREAVEELVRSKGIYSFRQSIENRRECCFIRKVEPLQRALAGCTAWISGLRREQGDTRADVRQFQVDRANGGIEKVLPLIAWTTQDVWDYIARHNLPYNKLYDRGFTSIGCEPCTTPTRPGESPRAGRWRWEQGQPKECGLHFMGSGI